MHPVWNELSRVIAEGDPFADRNLLLHIVHLRDTYQGLRVAEENIMRSTGRNDPKPLVDFHREGEKGVEKLYRELCRRDPVSQWATSVIGVGPVLALTIRAYVDISICESAGRIWRFAGLTEDTPKPKKGKKLTFCRPLKKTVRLQAESFKKLWKKPRSFYGYAYMSRKLIEQAKNERGDFAAQAARELETKNYGKATKARQCYEEGKLPPAHVDARALRWMGKLFLSHWHQIAYRAHFGKEPQKPYVIAILGHKDIITADDVLEWEKEDHAIPGLQSA